jgi:haloalkane dehalogenase
VRFITPSPEELSYLRPDPVLWEQELDVQPEAAERLESVVGMRSGRVYWRSRHDHLYALELGDLGRGRPSMAAVYGHWDRFEPRPPEHEINNDVLELLEWFSEVTKTSEPATVAKLARVRGNGRLLTWPEGSVLRTPDDRFSSLPGFAYEPRYVEIEGLRLAYVESGSGRPLLMLHGEPTWGYLYRRMIEPLARSARVIVPDLVGFGRSDKPRAVHAYSYRAHVRWMRRFVEALDLKNIVLVCQDWGGLIGLRVLSQVPERFSALAAMNTGIPPGVGGGAAFDAWRVFSQRAWELDVPKLIRSTLSKRKLTDAEAAAYGAPFPTRDYQTGALVFPRLVPTRRDHPGAYDNRVAIEKLKTLELPVLLLWGAEDAITRPSEKLLRKIFKNVAPPSTIEGAGHFIQEEAGEEVAEKIGAWLEGVGR